MKILTCSRSIIHEKWLMNWRNLTTPLGRVWQDFDQFLQKATHVYPKSTEAKTCCHIYKEPFSNVVMNSNLESRPMLKITTVFFFWKNQNMLSLQRQKFLLTEKEVCNNDKVLKIIPMCNVNNSLITGWICSLRKSEQSQEKLLLMMCGHSPLSVRAPVKISAFRQSRT